MVCSSPLSPKFGTAVAQSCNNTLHFEGAVKVVWSTGREEIYIYIYVYITCLILDCDKQNVTLSDGIEVRRVKERGNTETKQNNRRTGCLWFRWVHILMTTTKTNVHPPRISVFTRNIGQWSSDPHFANLVT